MRWTRKTGLVIVLSLAVLGSVRGVFYPNLKPDEFDKVVNGEKAALVEFYAPWCGHCKRLAPEFEKLGKVFEKDPDVVIAQVDADAHRSLGQGFGVKGFPTLKWIAKGAKDPRKDNEDVKVARNAEALVKYVNEKTNSKKKILAPESKVVHVTAETFETVVLDDSKHVLAEFYAPWCGHCKNLKPIFDQVSTVFDGEDVVLAAVDCDAHKDVCKKYDVGGYPTLKWFGKDSKTEPHAYDQGRDLSSFVKFINEKSGTDCSDSGDLVEGAGVVAELTDLARSLLAATEDTAHALLTSLSTKAEEVEAKVKKNADYYVKVGQRIVEKGASFVSTETARLQALLKDSASLKMSQIRSMKRRLNILGDFAADTESKEEL